jgi:RimJ/RimL family protein N-acetyltransferase
METERLFLRPWQMSDAERLFELAADPHVGPPCGWNPHQDPEESRQILQNILINDYTWAVVRRDDDLVIGNISLMPLHVSRLAEHETESEIGYWLGYPYWNQG